MLQSPDERRELLPSESPGGLVRREQRLPALADGLFGIAEPQGPGNGERHVPHCWSLGTLWRFKWSILLVTLLVAGAGTAAVWRFVAPTYKASAEIRVAPHVPDPYMDNKTVPLYQSYFNTQVATILKPEVLQRALDQPEVKKTAWFQREAKTLLGTPLTPMEKLRESLGVRPRGRSEIIDIWLTDMDPQEAATVVNAVVEQYVRFIQEGSQNDWAYQMLVREEARLRAAIEAGENIVGEMRRRLGTSDPEQLVAQQRVRLDGLQASVIERRREILTAEFRQRELRTVLGLPEEGDPEQLLMDLAQPQDQPSELTNQMRYYEDAQWQQTQSELRRLLVEVEVARNRFRDTHPSMMDLRKREQLAREALEERQAQLERQWQENPAQRPSVNQATAVLIEQLRQITADLKLLRYQEQLLLADMEQQRSSIGQVFADAETLTQENTNLFRNREQYGIAQARIQQKQMERNAPGSVSLWRRAEASSKPASDRRLLMTVTSLVVGFGVAVGLAMLRAGLNPAVFRPEEVVHAARAPFLGQLPLVASGQAGPGADPAFSECVRMIRTAVLQRVGGQEGVVMLVTSASSGAGKTTVATSLARSFAQCGKRVLLVDADLRHPRVAQVLGIESATGLVAALAQQAPDAETIVQTGTCGFDVLPAGQVGKNLNLELIANGVFSACVERWRGLYDLIVLDSPPMLPVADAQILARHADGSILVVRERHCRRAEVLGALMQLGSERDRFMGTVFIGSGRHGVYSRGYGYYSYSGGTNT